jgi:hypothetical protein
MTRVKMYRSLGGPSNLSLKPYTLKWIQGAVKSLEIYIINGVKLIQGINFNDPILVLWCLRILILKGKMTLIRSFIILQMLCTGTVLHISVENIEKVK